MKLLPQRFFSPRSFSRGLSYQRGMATVMINLLIGVSMTATAVGVLYSVRAMQERQISVQAQTNSQSLVWTAAEAVRLYLNTLDSDAIDAFVPNTTSFPITGLADQGDSFSALVTDVTNVGSNYEVTVNLRATDDSSASSSALAVVYQVTASASTDTVVISDAINFNKSVSLQGDIKFYGNTAGDISVNGDLNASGSIGDGTNGNLGAVKVNGDVVITSAIQAESLDANGNIFLSGSAGANTRIAARGYHGIGKGNIKIGSAGSIDNVQANGDILISNSTSIDNVQARGYIEKTGGGGTINNWLAATDDSYSDYFEVDLAPGENFDDKLNTAVVGGPFSGKTYQEMIDNGYRPYVNPAQTMYNASDDNYREFSWTVSLDPNDLVGNDAGQNGDLVSGDGVTSYTVNRVTFKGTAGTINAKGPILFDAGNITEMNSTSGVDCEANWRNVAGGGSIVAPVVLPTSGNCFRNASTTIARASIGSAPELAPIELEEPVNIDVMLLKSYAHYAFEREDTKYKVTVNNINGIANGVYYLGTYSESSSRQFICSAVNSNNECTDPAVSSNAKPFCGASRNSCVGYNGGTDRWSINADKNLPPGILWFDGSVATSGNGYLINSILATGDVEGDGVIAALNFVGYGPVCQLDYSFEHRGSTYEGSFDSDFAAAQMYPIDVCDMAASEYNPSALGNMAIMSGGYDENDDFQGGTVRLGAGNKIFGSVLSADIVDTSGNSNIFGYISATGQGNAGSNSLSATTIVDLRDLPSTYDPSITLQPSQTTTSTEATILWTRYL